MDNLKHFIRKYNIANNIASGATAAAGAMAALGLAASLGFLAISVLATSSVGIAMYVKKRKLIKSAVMKSTPEILKTIKNEKLLEEFCLDFNLNYDILNENLNLLTENVYSTPEQKGYAEYLIAHITNTKKGFFFIQANCPEMLEGADVQEIENNIIVHDESKYSNEEFDAYSKFFYGEKTPEVKRNFRLAWQHHWTHNPHHPEYWHGLDMPIEYIIEMICDWWSFSWKDHDLASIFDFWELAKRDTRSKKLSENTINTVQRLLNILKERLIHMNLI